MDFTGTELQLLAYAVTQHKVTLDELIESSAAAVLETRVTRSLQATSRGLGELAEKLNEEGY